MNKTYSLTIYTAENVLQFDVVSSLDNFIDVMAEALESGSVVVDMTDGHKLVLSLINAVGVEISEARAE